MGEITNVMEYQAIAKQKLPKMAYDYYASGAEDEWTLKENREAFSRILFVLPPHLTLKNFEGLDLGKMDQANDSGLASYVAGQIDRTLSWKLASNPNPSTSRLLLEMICTVCKVIRSDFSDALTLRTNLSIFRRAECGYGNMNPGPGNWKVLSFDWSTTKSTEKNCIEIEVDGLHSK
ncbi:Peroxisomal (S)-2-hydroxy-acid oxidase GLO5 [Panicum miliaceum]|uniref:Peroxisomal (S)-2-hydroxy-acid oxidase GLO5 n=1 Tax=Panicum miliaceum TaxID=4540 RepID=A0A3L6TI56_PANMI|nr:Peroxisomal (S)-2-hydroxy-acid oxidase GLO5 [Panicum miliaceum]